MNIQSLNPLSLCLEKPEHSKTHVVLGYGYEVAVELYNTSAKIEYLRAYTFHPNKTTWWNSIKNWLIEVFYGKTAILVRVREESIPLYMKVDDLKSVLNVSRQVIQKLNSPEVSTPFIVNHQIKQTVQKVNQIAHKSGLGWSTSIQSKIEHLIQRAGYRNIFKVIDHPQFKSQMMISTLIKISEQLALSLPPSQTIQSQTCYEFEIALPDIYIWKVENHQRTKINLNGCKLNEEDFVAQTIDRFKALLPLEANKWTQIEDASIRTLVNHIGYKNILAAIQYDQFSKKLITSTLLELGRVLAGYPCTDIRYQESLEFEIALPDIYIWKVENQKKIKINLKDLKLIEEDSSIVSSNVYSVAQTHPSATSKKKITISTEKEKKEFEKIVAEFSLNRHDMNLIDALAKRVGYSNLIDSLKQLDKVENKRIMINTFIEIGNTFSVPAIFDGIFAPFRLQYTGKKKLDKKQLTYAFAIRKKDIFIAQKKLNEGGFKTVSSAIKLNDLEDPFVRIKMKSPENGTSKAKNEDAIKEIRKEVRFIAKVHENKTHRGRSCIVLPYLCEIPSNGKQEIVLIQKRYTDGIRLKEASVANQAHVLRDIAIGLAFIHDLGFVHMDMKPGNFLLEGNLDGNSPIKGRVSDFGMTVEKGFTIVGGTPFYYAPEAFHRCAQANEKMDSFAFGITILEILDKPPTQCLGKMTQYQIDDEIAQYRTRVHMLHSKHEIRMKAAMLDVVADLLKYGSGDRLSCAAAVERLDKIAQANISRAKY